MKNMRCHFATIRVGKIKKWIILSISGYSALLWKVQAGAIDSGKQ